MVQIQGLDAMRDAIREIGNDALIESSKKALSRTMKKMGFGMTKKRSHELDALIKTAEAINDLYITNSPIAGELLRLFEIRERFHALVGYRLSLKPNSRSRPRVNFEMVQLRTEELKLEYVIKKMEGKFIDYTETPCWTFDKKIISRALIVFKYNFEKADA